MKRIFLCSTFIISIIVSFGQAPQAFNYQAILRNSDGTIKVNKTVAIQINLIDDLGASAYMEVHNTQTNQLGLVNLVIGEGTSSDDLSTVDWANGPYFLDITVNGVSMGSSPLFGVPYALYAIEAGYSFSGDYTELENLPSYFTPKPHNHSENEISDLKHYTDSDISGNEFAFNNWDKDVSDDFDGSYSDLSNVPSEFKPAVHYHSEINNLQDRVKDLEDLLADGNIKIKDVDGNEYGIVSIGDQIWMSENLRVTRYSDGIPIPKVSEKSNWNSLEATDRAYCYYDNDSAKYAGFYGALYTWTAARNGNSSSTTNPSNVQGVCPSGWHIPSDQEWKELEIYLGMDGSDALNEGLRGTNEGSKLSGHEILWQSDILTSDQAFGETGFNGSPAGVRNIDGGFTPAIGEQTVWWSTTLYTTLYAWDREIKSSSSGISRERSNKKMGLSIRCLKD